MSNSKTVIEAMFKSKLYDVYTHVIENFPKDTVYLVGGALRNAFLGTEIEDLDFATSLKPDDILTRLKGEKLILTGFEFGTVTWVVNLGENKNVAVEITSFRCAETYNNKSRRPEDFRFGDSLIEDLKRRDFTVNAMAYVKGQNLIDPFGGLIDLNKRRLVSVGDAHTRFSEDPLRILRLYRFSLNYGFSIENKTFLASKRNLNLLSVVSKERVFNEFKKTFSKSVDKKAFKNLLYEFLDKKSIKDIDLLFENDPKGSEFNLFEKVYFVYKFFPGYEVFLLEKIYKNVFILFVKLKTTKTLLEYKILLLNFSFKNNLDEEECKRLWQITKNIKLVFSNQILEFHPKRLEDSVLEKEKALHTGKALGLRIRSLELDNSFKLVDDL